MRKQSRGNRLAVLLGFALGILPAAVSAQSVEVTVGGGKLYTAATLAQVKNVRDGVEVHERTQISPGWSIVAAARSSILPWFSVSLGGLTTVGSTLDVYRMESSCPPPCNRRTSRAVALTDASLSVVDLSGALELPGSTITPGLKLGLNVRRYGIDVDDLSEPFAFAFEPADWMFGWNYGVSFRFASGKWSGSASLERLVSKFESLQPLSAREDQEDTSLSLQFGRVFR